MMKMMKMKIKTKRRKKKKLRVKAKKGILQEEQCLKETLQSEQEMGLSGLAEHSTEQALSIEKCKL